MNSIFRRRFIHEATLARVALLPARRNAQSAGKFRFFNFSTSCAEAFTLWNSLLGGAFLMPALIGIRNEGSQPG